MRNIEREVVLGGVVFIAAVIVVVGGVWLSERYAGAAGGYRLQVYFESVAGLQRGNPVTLRGVWVGKVLNIFLDKGRPVVTIGFESLDKIPRDSRLNLKDEGMLGGKVIELQLGSDRVLLKDGEFIEGFEGGGIERITKSAAEMSDRLNNAVGEITDRRNIEQIEHIISQVDSTATILKSVLKENRNAITGTLDSLARASGGAKSMLDENREGIRRSVENMETATGRLSTMIQSLEEMSHSAKALVEEFNQISQKLNRGEGTIGRLVQEDDVYLHLEKTLTSVDSLLEDIKRDPTRYFNFSVF